MFHELSISDIIKIVEQKEYITLPLFHFLKEEN